MTSELQSLCSHCHESHKKFAQHRGFERATIGEDGWPIDAGDLPMVPMPCKAGGDQENLR